MREGGGYQEWKPVEGLRVPPSKVGYAIGVNVPLGYDNSLADVGDPVFVETFTVDTNPQVGEVVELSSTHPDDVRVRVQTDDGPVDRWFGASKLFRADQAIYGDSRYAQGGPLVLQDGTVVKYGTVLEGLAQGEEAAPVLRHRRRLDRLRHPHPPPRDHRTGRGRDPLRPPPALLPLGHRRVPEPVEALAVAV